jgi:hypothetical protein
VSIEADLSPQIDMLVVDRGAPSAIAGDVVDRPASEPKREFERWELTAIFTVVALDAIWTGFNSRHWWFLADFWHYASREGPGAWLGHHGGHLNVFNVAVARLVIADGFDYWPLWGVLRALFSPVIGLSAWLALRRADTRPLIALGAATAITTFWYDVFIAVVLVNIPITLTCLAFLSFLVSTGRRRWLLAVSAIGVAAGSTMVLGLVAMTAAMVRRPQYRPLLPWLLAPLVPYGLWYRLVRPSSGSTGDLLGQSDVPAALWTMLEAGVRTYLLGVPVPELAISGLTAVLVGRQLLRLFGPTRVGLHEEFFTLALGLLLLALFRERVLGGFPGTAPRYGFHLTYFLVMAVAPSLNSGTARKADATFAQSPRGDRRWLRIAVDGAVLAAMVAVPVLQLSQRAQSYQWGQDRGALVQTRVLAAGHLLANGADHYPDQGYLPGTEGGGALEVADLIRYLDAGWEPGSPGPLELDRAQADLLTALRQVPAWQQDCSPPTGLDESSLALDEEATLIVVGPPNSELSLLWSGGAFVAPTELVDRIPATGTAEVRIKASPFNSAVVQLRDDQRICRR